MHFTFVFNAVVCRKSKWFFCLSVHLQVVLVVFDFCCSIKLMFVVLKSSVRIFQEFLLESRKSDFTSTINESAENAAKEYKIRFRVNFFGFLMQNCIFYDVVYRANKKSAFRWIYHSIRSQNIYSVQCAIFGLYWQIRVIKITTQKWMSTIAECAICNFHFLSFFTFVIFFVFESYRLPVMHCTMPAYTHTIMRCVCVWNQITESKCFPPSPPSGNTSFYSLIIYFSSELKCSEKKNIFFII